MFFVASAQQRTITPYAVAGGQIGRAAAPLRMQKSSPTAVAAAPHGDLLYAATASGSIYLYRIRPGGSLQQADGGAAVAHVDQPVRMTLDRSGNWLFVASSSTPQLFQFRVNPASGALQRITTEPTSLSAAGAAEIYLSPDNRNLFAALGAGGVDAFSFDPGSGTVGALLHIAPSGSPGAKDGALTADPESRFLFVGESGKGIRVLRIVTDGVLHEIAGSPFTAPSLKNASALAVGPADRELVVADSSSDMLEYFSTAANGALTWSSSSASNLAASPAALSAASTGYLVGVSGGSSPSVKLLGF
jgi:6-phosphogluconolactonase (cycloisomerase 2 family)